MVVKFAKPRASVRTTPRSQREDSLGLFVGGAS